MTSPSYDGIEATFAYCEHKLGVVGNPEDVKCSALLARGNRLAELRVYVPEPRTEEAVAELLRLTPTAVEALIG